MKRATSGSTYDSIVSNVREGEGVIIRQVKPGEEVDITTEGRVVFVTDDDSFVCWYVGPEPKPCSEQWEISISGITYIRRTFTLEPGTAVIEDLDLNYAITLRRVIICPVEDRDNPPPDDGVTAPIWPDDPSRTSGAAEQIPDLVAERELLGVG